MHNIVLSPISLDDFVSKVSNEVVRKIESQNKIQKRPHEGDDLLTRDEACEFLKIDSSTLWAWTNKGKVKAYGIGNRRYYKRSELIDALTPLKK